MALTKKDPADNDRNYTEVVLTGGPGGGKTTSISFLMRHFSERGLRVLCVPEMATLLFNSGISDLNALRTDDPRAYAQIQGQLLMMYQSMRKHFQALATALAPQPTLIIFDRAEMDSSCYMDQEMFWAVLKENGLTLESVRDSYDMVVHLVTAADGAVEHYTLENNKARWESPEQAIASDSRTLKAWLGHPHLRVVDNSTDFEGKLNRLAAHVSGVLGGPTHIEYERRYLLKTPPKGDTPELLEAQKISIEQTYLRTDEPDTELRLRKWAQGEQISYFWTRKRRLESGGREEREALIRPSEYVHLLGQTDPTRRPIRKVRHCFVHHGQHCELDRIQRPDDEDMWILEVELVDENVPFTPPEWLDIDKEVTDDPTYSNAQLSIQ